ncbi:glycosyltransferase family 2 protein [Citrobacter freundii]|nr:glycosyltransferase [Citrobacter freundii]HBU6168048.1 glycosyltransferase [Citrobacter freundii]HBV8020181.1 glycosyltransferase [Citrobacter freundii]HEG1870116.1 glycosyltransferase [Citrobacter freundii]
MNETTELNLLKSSPKFLLSVIIPCYNCREYIYECLHSVYDQIDDSVEIIIINDGSTDGSLEKIELFLSNNREKSIKFISQKNQGLSVARNTGINVASANYLAFLDGDDLWDENFWLNIKPTLQNNDIDLVEFNAVRFYEGNIEKRTPVSIVTQGGTVTISSIRDLSETFKKNEWFAWSRIYKKSLFNSIKFPVGKNYEDIATIPLLYLKSKSIHRIGKELLLYRVREGSITCTPSIKNIDDIISALHVFKKIKNQNHEKNIDIIAPAVYSTYSLIRRVSTQKYGYCFFDKKQIKNLKEAISPLKETFKNSTRVKIKYMPLYCFINRVKFLMKNKIKLII